MNLQQLQYFLTIADTGSFRQAAERLYVAQPALSYGISALENDLDAKLFDRGKGKTKLTPAGEALLEEAKLILHHVDRAYQKVQKASESQDGRLRICCLGFLMTLCFNGVIAPFMAVRPEVSVTLEQDYLMPMIRKLERKETDLVITRADTLDSVRCSNVQKKILYHDEYYLVVPNGHPLAHLDYIDDMSVLAEEPFITLDPGVAKEFCDRIFHICGGNNYTPKVVSTAPFIDILYTQIAARMGISILPRFRGYFDANLDLKYISIGGVTGTSNDVVALWDGDSKNPNVALFVEFLDTLNLDS